MNFLYTIARAGNYLNPDSREEQTSKIKHFNCMKKLEAEDAIEESNHLII